MPQRAIKIEPASFYHVYNRGNNKEPIFFEPANYQFFLNRFSEYFPEDTAEIHAYCLLPNHFHILIRLRREFDYSIRMQHFSISYAKSLNNWAGRVGHVFQGRYKAKQVGSTAYVLHLSRYIHLNPVLARLVRNPEEWEFSSYRDYLVDSRNHQEDSREISGIHSRSSILTRKIKREDSPNPMAGPREISGIYTRPLVTTNFILSHFVGVNDYRSFVDINTGNITGEMGDELWKEGEIRSLFPKGV